MVGVYAASLRFACLSRYQQIKYLRRGKTFEGKDARKGETLAPLYPPSSSTPLWQSVLSVDKSRRNNKTWLLIVTVPPTPACPDVSVRATFLIVPVFTLRLVIC